MRSLFEQVIIQRLFVKGFDVYINGQMYVTSTPVAISFLYFSVLTNSSKTGNDDAGLPIVRAMFLEFPEDPYANTKAMQYQYMLGENLLVAPIYTETAAIDAMGNDVRNGIYLAGGGALLRGLDKRLTDKINIPFHIAEDPLLSVAKGTGIALKNVNRFSFLMR